MDYIYVLFKKGEETCKIGSTQNYVKRMIVYRTDKPEFGSDYYDVHIWEVKHDSLNCYEIDALIQFHEPFKKYRSKTNGGTEIYYLSDILNITKFFDKHSIIYKKIDTNMDKIYEESSKLEYVECLKYNYEETLKKLLIVNNKLNLSSNDDETLLKEDDESYEDIGKLRPYQEDCINSLINFIGNDKRKSGLVVMPTGTGKTFIIKRLVFYLMEILKGDVMIITKNKTIYTKKNIESFNKLINSTKFKDIIKIENLIYDKEKNIKLFTKKSKYNRIFIINSDKFLSSKRYKDYELGFNEHSRIYSIIHDESHWVSGSKISKFFKYLKDNKNIKKIIGFSATPVRESNMAVDIVNDVYDNYILYQMSLSNAILNNYIVPINFKIIETSNEDDNSSIKNIETLKQVVDILKQILENSIKRKGIIWFKSIDELEYFSKKIKDYEKDLNIDFWVCHSKIADKENKLKLDEFEKDNINNVILLVVFEASEGYDVPDCDFGIELGIVKDRKMLLRTQRMGRIMRPYENKKVGYYYIFENDLDIKKIAQIYVNWLLYISNYIEINNNKYVESKHKSGTDKELIKKDVEVLNDPLKISGINDLDLENPELKSMIFKYYRQEIVKSGLSKFKKYVKSLNIKTVSEYLARAEKDLNLIPNPFEEFKGFKWGMILDINPALYYTKSELIEICKEAFNKYDKIISIYSFKEMICKLNKINNKIPEYNLWEELYNINDLNDILLIKKKELYDY